MYSCIYEAVLQCEINHNCSVVEATCMDSNINIIRFMLLYILTNNEFKLKFTIWIDNHASKVTTHSYKLVSHSIASVAVNIIDKTN